MNILDKDEFRSWLMATDQDREDFLNNDPFTCPLARFLKEVKHFGDPTVTLDGYYDRETTDERDAEIMPLWARSFVKTIDGDTTDSDIVRPAFCLGVLEGIGWN